MGVSTHPDGGGGGAQGIDIAVGQHDVGARHRQHPRRLPPDAAGGARDHRGPALERETIEHAHRSGSPRRSARQRQWILRNAR
jgi:hypothetical protein